MLETAGTDQQSSPALPPSSPSVIRLDVHSVAREAEDVTSFVLTDPTGAPLPSWESGSHVDVLIQPDMVRQYSLCGDPADRARWRIAVLREEDGRGGSRYLCDQVGPGSPLEVRTPRNNFPLAEADSYVLVAGGIGITPLLPMVGELDRRHANWRLHYGGRRRSRMAFLEELAAFAGRVTCHPEDECGLMPLDAILGWPTPGTLVYCCGPEGLLTAVEQRCRDWPTGSLRTEHFHPKERTEDEAADKPLTVLLRRSGKIVRVGADQSVLDALNQAGVDVPSSCREGTCASCESTVVEGEIDHRDSVLTAQEQASGKTMMICVSRARTDRLVLDM